MNRLSPLFLSLALLSLTACKSDEQAERAGEELETEIKAESPSEAKPGAEGEPRRTMKEVMEAVTQSIKDAKSSETGDTVCERAYNGQVAMTAKLMEALGSEDAPPQVDKAAFLEVCESADAEMQQCLVPSYALENREACRALKESAGPEFAAKLKALGDKARQEQEAGDAKD